MTRNITIALAAFTLALGFALPSAFATNLCNLGGCIKTSVTVKSGSGLTCNGTQANCDCNTYAINNGYLGGACQPLTKCQSSGGFDITSCSNGYACCATQAGRNGAADDAEADSVGTDISSVLGTGEALSRTASYWGWYNGSLKSQSTGVGSNCEAKIHVCFVHGFSDLTGVTDQNGCNNACNSATNTNQNECFDTDCSSRCGGWWTGSDSCS